jgi:NTP pyrophosphatase (non-canonical NTP hydrolase)
MLDLNAYQKEAAKTLPKDADVIRLLRIGAYNLWEAGEIGNIIKKLDEHGWELDVPRARLEGKTPREAIIEEAGDLLWALASVLTAVGGSLEKVAQGNIEKLRLIHGEAFNLAAVKERGLKSPTKTSTEDGPCATCPGPRNCSCYSGGSF